MTSFDRFLRELLFEIDISNDKEFTIQQVRTALSKMNEYLFVEKEGLGTTEALDEEFEYISEFHKFWEENHKMILNPTINDNTCEKLAEILHQLFVKHGKKLFYELYDVGDLKKEDICKVRFFSANQDFRGSREFEDIAKIYQEDPSLFDKENIRDNPENFLRGLKITKLSQTDKRMKYAKTSAELLINKKIEPYQLLEYFDNDAWQLREFLISSKGAGYGKKKTDMFIRDMFVLGVWVNIKNFDKIDVASDVNTVKVALRTGILKTEIPLLSSLLDIFCYQYGLIDEVAAKAWRTVWEKWSHKYPQECIESPSLIDYLVYRIIGKEFCNESLCLFECKKEHHKFMWHSSKNRTCQICYKKRIRNVKAEPICKVLPCTHDEGNIVITKSKYVNGPEAILNGITECPFKSICLPMRSDFKALNPPKSISILGRTGWDSARAKSKLGGGGLMS